MGDNIDESPQVNQPENQAAGQPEATPTPQPAAPAIETPAPQPAAPVTPPQPAATPAAQPAPAANPMGDPAPAAGAAPQTGSARKKTILQILPALNSGGVERGTVDIAIAAAKAGYNSLVASSGGPMVAQLEAAGIKHITMPLDSKNPWRVYKNMEDLVYLIADENIDLLHARSRMPAWSAYLASKKTGCHFVTTFHGHYSNTIHIKIPEKITEKIGHDIEFNLKFPPKKIYNSIMTKGERVIAVSQFIADHIREKYKAPLENIRVIPRGVDLNYFDPAKVTDDRVAALKEQWRITEDWPVILLPGRITRWKGQEFLLRTLTRIEKYPFYCVICGDSTGHETYYSEIMNQMMQSRLEKKVRIIGPTNDMPAAYKLASVVVSASIEPEAFGRVAAEAQAMGKPVVATNLGGSRETVVHGETGRLVDIYTTEDMAEGLKRGVMLSDTDKAGLALKNRKHIVDNFSLDTMLNKTMEVYKEVLGS